MKQADSSTAETQRLHAAFSLAKRRAPSFIVNEIAARMAEKLAVIRVPVQSIGVQLVPSDTVSLASLRRAYPLAQGLPKAQPSGISARLKQFGARLFSQGSQDKQHQPDQEAKQASAAKLATWLPEPSQTQSLIWANLSAAWSQEPLSLAQSWFEGLDDGGFVMFSSLGPDTAKQLSAAFSTEERASMAKQLVDMHDWGDALVHAGFSDPVMDMEAITLTYRDASLALQELASALPTKPARPGLRSRLHYEKLLAHFEQQRNHEGLLPLSLEVIYGHAFKVKRDLKTPTVTLDALKATLPSRRA